MSLVLNFNEAEKLFLTPKGIIYLIKATKLSYCDTRYTAQSVGQKLKKGLTNIITITALITSQ